MTSSGQLDSRPAAFSLSAFSSRPSRVSGLLKLLSRDHVTGQPGRGLAGVLVGVVARRGIKFYPRPPPCPYHTYYLLLKSERGKGRDFEKVKIKGSCIEVMAATTFNYWQILMMIMHRVRCESGGDWGGCCLTLGPPAGLPPQDHCVSQNQSMPKYKHSLLNKAV